MMTFEFFDVLDDLAVRITTDTEEHAWMELCDIFGTEYTMDNVILRGVVGN